MARGTAECVASIGKCSIRSCLIQLMSFRTTLELWWRMYPTDSKFLLCSWSLTVASRIQWRASPSGPSGHDYCNALQRVWPTTLDAPAVMTFPTQLKNPRWMVSRKWWWRWTRGREGQMRWVAMTLANLHLLVEMRGEAVLVGVDMGDREDIASPVNLANVSSRPPLLKVKMMNFPWPPSLLQPNLMTFSTPHPTTPSFPWLTDVTNVCAAHYTVPRKMTVMLVSNATRSSMGATCSRSMQNLDCSPMHQQDMEQIWSPLHHKIWSPLHHKHHNLSQPCDIQLGKEKLAAPFPWKSPQHPHNLSLDIPFWGPLRANVKVCHSIIFFHTTDFLNRNGCSGNPVS